MAMKTAMGGGFDEPLLVRAKEAQEVLACSRSHVYALAEAGYLKTVRLGPKRGSGLRFCAASLRDFVAGGGCQTATESAATPTTKTAMGAAGDWRRQARARLDGDQGGER
jgi:hypothetical protein